MKKLNFFAHVLILSFLFSAFFVMTVQASEMENVEEVQMTEEQRELELEAAAIEFLATIDDFVPDEMFLKDEDYRDSYEAYTFEIMYIAKAYVDGGYDLDTAMGKLEKLISNRNETLSRMEQKILDNQIKSEQNANAQEQGKVEGFVDIMTMYDKDGNAIIDYTNIDFSNMSNKRTITVQGILQEGTATSNDFYVKVNVAARNLIYEPEPTILDQSNNYTAKIDVPNDKYLIYFSNSATNDIVYIAADGNTIDARMNPKITFDIIGAIKIDSNVNEITMIESNQYTEVVDEDNSEINVMLIVVIALSVIAAIAVGFGIYHIIKIKKENEI